MTEKCANCRFYKDNGARRWSEGYRLCRRYPEHVKTHDGHWCGEHKPVGQEPKIRRNDLEE